MNTNNCRKRTHTASVGALVLALTTLSAATGRGQLFVARWYSGASDGAIGAYSTFGGTLNSSLVTGLTQPAGLAADGSGHLFVAGFGSRAVGEYSTSGAVINAALIHTAGE